MKTNIRIIVTPASSRSDLREWEESESNATRYASDNNPIGETHQINQSRVEEEVGGKDDTAPQSVPCVTELGKEGDNRSWHIEMPIAAREVPEMTLEPITTAGEPGEEEERRPWFNIEVSYGPEVSDQETVSGSTTPTSTRQGSPFDESLIHHPPSHSIDDDNTSLCTLIQDTDPSAVLSHPDLETNHPSPLGYPPLLTAVANRNTEMVALILPTCTDQDLNFRSSSGHTALSQAIAHNDAASLQLLLKRPGLSLVGALCLALQSADEEVIRLLLQRRDLDVNTAYSGTTPLQLALECPPAILQLLLARHDLQLNNTSVPYMRGVIERGDSVGLTLLLQRHDLDLNRCDENGATTLTMAVESGSAEMVGAVLKRHDVDVNKTSVLHIAAKHGDKGVLALLLGRGDADVNRTDDRGFTPLRTAVESG
ncbi:ankyrin, partial [Wilcoxina mikolae CBS 423.85]